MSARFLVAGGGTGGHVTPALALAEELAAGGDEVLILGSQRGLETELVPAAGFALVTLPSQQFVGKSLAQRLRAVAGLASFGASTPRRRPAPPFRLLVFGGSQGARQLNAALRDALPHLAGTALEVFHQTGAADRDAVAEAYESAGVPARVVAFEPDMPARYRWADLAVCRAGALTVAELALAGLPAILVPLASAADDHQTANARALEAAGAARRLDPRGLSGKELADAISGLVADPDALAGMGRRAGLLARPDAAARIAGECRELARDRRRG